MPMHSRINRAPGHGIPKAHMPRYDFFEGKTRGGKKLDKYARAGAHIPEVNRTKDLASERMKVLDVARLAGIRLAEAELTECAKAVLLENVSHLAAVEMAGMVRIANRILIRDAGKKTSEYRYAPLSEIAAVLRKYYQTGEIPSERRALIILACWKEYAAIDNTRKYAIGKELAAHKSS